MAQNSIDNVNIFQPYAADELERYQGQVGISESQPLLTPLQLEWLAMVMAPGAGTREAMGKMPDWPSRDMTREEMYSTFIPSMEELYKTGHPVQGTMAGLFSGLDAADVIPLLGTVASRGLKGAKALSTIRRAFSVRGEKGIESLAKEPLSDLIFPGKQDGILSLGQGQTNISPSGLILPPGVSRTAKTDRNLVSGISTEGMSEVVPMDIIIPKLAGASSEGRIIESTNIQRALNEGLSVGGVKPRARQPLEVTRLPNGKLQLEGGGSAYETLLRQGATNVPVRIFGDVAEFRRYDDARKAAKDKRITTDIWSLMPRAGDPTFEQSVNLLGTRVRKGLDYAFSTAHQTGIRSADQLNGVAINANPSFQFMLENTARNMGLRTAATRLSDLVKSPTSIRRKMRAKYDDDPSRITDAVRNRVLVDTPQESDAFAKAIADMFPTMDSGHQLYPRFDLVDRKLNIQFVSPTGDPIIGEIGIRTPAMHRAGEMVHPYYEAWRTLVKKYDSTKIPVNAQEEILRLVRVQQQAFREAQRYMDPSWFEPGIQFVPKFRRGGQVSSSKAGTSGRCLPISPYISSNSSLGNSEPLIGKSAYWSLLARTQRFPSNGMKNPRDSSSATYGSMTAGLSSQEKYKRSYFGSGISTIIAENCKKDH